MLDFENSYLMIFYVTLLIIVFGSFSYLIFSDPGFLKNRNAVNLLDLVENKVKINDYCPVCVVINL
jgi:hypothetical protein